MARKSVTRRQLVQLAAGAVAVSPFINLGSYRLFASSATVYSDDSMRAILGENFRRALSEIWVS